ncbi:MAG: protein phosphatase CheZ [Rhodospirillales bacterium]|jgi:chemotaxis protein CheZ|nr:protein phosphatase CheZ [Rhodospirillales bacterium]MDP6773838.1 protein phosphatase CheZ [Rhodospirillales bacterium]
MPTGTDAVIARQYGDPLKKEISGLFQYIQRVRQEIAAIDRPADDEYKFGTMGEQLDAIVKATEEATNTIMETMEKNEQLLDELKKQLEDPQQIALIDKLVDNGNSVFEACSFQDITGQRVTKVVKSVTYIEDRVNALISIWGKAALEEVEVKPVNEKTADEELLHGPQLEGEGISQADIDKLFD